MAELRTLLSKMTEKKASDLFITANRPPCVKVHGYLEDLSDQPLTVEHAAELVLSMMSDKQKKLFIEHKESNFAIHSPELGRFRVSAFVQRNHIAAVLRRIETTIPSIQDLDVPDAIGPLVMAKRGLVILVGATGTGKSSTLAAMIGHRNQFGSGHIITIEDPIEFIHEHQKCIITQREVGIDTDSFEVALKNTLRQAPDIILIGEIRSQETMEYAINFAETGHLCLATLHANNANQAFERIINFFPPSKHHQLWMDLSLNINAIIAQQLVPRSDASGRVPVVEILLNTPVIADHIKKGSVDDIKQFMTEDSSLGMQTFDQALFKRYKDNQISYEDALRYADSANELRLMIKLNDGDTGESSLDGIRLRE